MFKSDAVRFDRRRGRRAVRVSADGWIASKVRIGFKSTNSAAHRIGVPRKDINSPDRFHQCACCCNTSSATREAVPIEFFGAQNVIDTIGRSPKGDKRVSKCNKKESE